MTWTKEDTRALRAQGRCLDCAVDPSLAHDHSAELEQRAADEIERLQARVRELEANNEALQSHVAMRTEILAMAERAERWCSMSSPGHDELRRWREQGRAPAGSCPFCASRISVIERDGVFVARCSHRGCGARGPKHHDLTRACDLFCCPPQRTAGGMGGIDAGGTL